MVAEAPLYVPPGQAEAFACPVADTYVPLMAGSHDVDPLSG